MQSTPPSTAIVLHTETGAVEFPNQVLLNTLLRSKSVLLAGPFVFRFWCPLRKLQTLA